MMRYLVLVLVLVATIPVAEADWSGDVAGEFRSFFDDPIGERQHSDNASISFEPEYYRDWNDRSDSLTFIPFLRWDENDDERSHFDVRELIWTHAADEWELRAGIGKVFWGVTESQHLVDIINQTDLVENLDGEDKLGQPMIDLTLIRDWGIVDLFLLPGFRERTFPGVEGRLRTMPHVDESQAEFESSSEEQHIDFAARWSHTLGDWDLGVSHFHGTSRDPRFSLGADDGEPILIPIYDIIDQTGVDVQMTRGSWLWKFEGIYRSGQGVSFNAATAGFEYTFFDVHSSGIDVGVLAEYLYDDRNEDAATPFQDDLFVGSRLAFNDVQDTQILFGVIGDLGADTRFWNLEASRRFRDNWVISIEGRLIRNPDETDPLFSLRNDDHLQLEVAYHF